MIELTDEERRDLKAAIDVANNTRLRGIAEHFNLYTEEDKLEAKRQIESWRLLRMKLGLKNE